MKKVLLIGNPNVGKTSLYNILTGSFEQTGNWTGVTVDSVSEKLKGNSKIEIVDLPGVYSLEGNSLDEKVVTNYLYNEHYDLIVNIVDGINLERNFNLTLSLIKLKKPMIVAINFVDELKKNNIAIDDRELEKLLNTRVVLISARKKLNIDKLILEIESENKYIPISNIKIDDIKRFIKVESKSSEQDLTHKIDKVLLNKYFAFVVFAFVMFCVYYISLKLGGYFGDLISSFFERERQIIYDKLSQNVSGYIVTFLTVAVIGGVGQVVSFLPQILLLFLLLSLIEESGYMSRVAFIFDRLFRSIGINGKSVFPLVLSMGCTVSGVMATRTIENNEEREKTIFLTSFIPCGAKLVVFAFFAEIFFNGSPFVAVSLYFMSILVVIVLGKITMKNNGESGDFLLEIPNYRLPTLKNTFYVVIDKLKEFIFRAGSVIFTISVVYWFLCYFGTEGYNNGNINKSFLYLFGNYLKYIFYPLGFYDWRIASSYLSGIFARESIVESLSISTSNFDVLFQSGLHAYSFLLFIMLSPPCLATISVTKRELKSIKKIIKLFFSELLVAYLISFLLNIIYISIKSPIYLILLLIVVIIIIGIKYSIKKKLEMRYDRKN